MATNSGRNLYRSTFPTSSYKYKEELDWWKNVWDRKIREVGYFHEDLFDVLNEPRLIGTYQEQRIKEARALVLRTLREVGITDPNFFKDKIVVDLGPACMGMLEMSGARTKIAVEPLALAFDTAGLLLKPSDVVYLAVEAEKIPLLSNFCDVVVCRNTLDHVSNPRKTIREVVRILRPKGHFILNVDVGGVRTICEPHSFTEQSLEELLVDFERKHKKVLDFAHAGVGKAIAYLLQVRK